MDFVSGSPVLYFTILCFSRQCRTTGKLTFIGLPVSLKACLFYCVRQEHLVQMFSSRHHGEHVLIVGDRHVNQH